MTPYEVYFYSSGAVEDGWGLKDLGLNKVTAMIGYGLGGFLSFSLMIVAARALPAAEASTRSSSARRRSRPQHALGQVGLLLALVGILFAVGGAAIETSLLRRLQHRPSSSAGAGARRSARPLRRASRSRGS